MVTFRVESFPLLPYLEATASSPSLCFHLAAQQCLSLTSLWSCFLVEDMSVHGTEIAWIKYNAAVASEISVSAVPYIFII